MEARVAQTGKIQLFCQRLLLKVVKLFS